MADVDPRLEFVGNAKPTTLTGSGLSLTGMSFQVADATNYPTGAIGNFPIVINRTGSTAEKVLCSAQSGGVFTIVQRGYDGTVPATHDANETVEVCWPATEADLSNSHRASTAGVHGVAGNVVGDTDTQTLSGKTISGSANTLSNIPQTAITGLATSFAGKLDVPATAIAKGSLLVGTGANVADSLAVGAAGGILVAQSDGSLAYLGVGADGTVLTIASGMPVYGAIPSAILGSTAYTSSVTVPTSRAALDATNLTLTFTAPASGKVLLRIATLAQINQSTSFGWYTHGTTTAVGTDQAFTTSAAFAGRAAGEQILTGLTSGQSYHLDLTGHCNVTGATIADTVLTAWAA